MILGQKFIACATDKTKGGAIRKLMGVGAGEVQKIYSRGSGGGGGVGGRSTKKNIRARENSMKKVHARQLTLKIFMLS